MIFINLHKEANGPHLGDGETFATLESARQNAAYFEIDSYICTLELTDDGHLVRRHTDIEAIEMIVCERKFKNQDTEDCVCGHHHLMPAEPDVGIMNSYLEAL